ncbi:MAG: peptide chain release factor N(5)-glutamine methyltransferase [Candidatus Omnitrophica bacterium]|nr:peptide chain release factor N(5)-glutamine methyltransferase [Candidatus Omnitrophota bacterium]
MNEWELLFTEILGCLRYELYLKNNLKFKPYQRDFLFDALKRRMDHEPLQYILGKTEFMGLEFKVNKDVFIPRPETEHLVEHTLRLISSLAKDREVLRILDLGTGSGCIAISIAKYVSYNNIVIDATDISQEALHIAKLNAQCNQVKINFLQTDLFLGLKFGLYDIIVSNPPYVPSSQIGRFSKEIFYEPVIALDGGRRGLRFFYRIIRDAHLYLKKDGYLIMEIGYGQLNSIKKIFRNIRNLKMVEVIKDYTNIDRVIIAKNYG